MRSTLFKFFGIPVRSYGLMMVVGFALGLWRAVRAGRRRDFPPERIYDLALVALLSGVVGARIVYGHDPESWATMPQAPLAIT